MPAKGQFARYRARPSVAWPLMLAGLAPDARGPVAGLALMDAGLSRAWP
jgi:hypothetical protein